MQFEILFLIVFIVLLYSGSCNRCCQISSERLPQYKVIRKNAKSTQYLISEKSVTNLSECEEYVSSKKALAFNFILLQDKSSLHFHDNTVKDSLRFSCQALECPETQNFTTLVLDANSLYFSIYSTYTTAGVGTSTCVPKAGLFTFSNHNVNYTQAQDICQRINGTLAHIASEKRTNELAKLIPKETPVFVGLSNRDNERLWKNEYDEPLSCFDYRAWGTGEPSYSKGCVGLVQPRKIYLPPFWTVVPCNALLPFICEITPTY